MKWSRRAAGALGLLLLTVGATAAAAERVDIEVTVCQLGEASGGIDPKCSRLHEKVKRDFRYGSLKVVTSKRLALAPNQVGAVALPNGATARVRPHELGGERLLLSAEVGALMTDVKVEKGQLVVLDGGPHAGGKLAVSFEARW